MIKLTSDKKRYISDFLYTVSASLLLQGVLHLIVNPYINYKLGSEVLGNVVFYMSIVYIFAQSLGYSLCHTRQVVRKSCEAKNGDYNIILGVILIISSVAGGIIASFYIHGLELIFFVIILTFTVTRYYALVEYRLKMNFKLCLIYFAIISAGYLLGLVVFSITDKWYYIYAFGEVAVVVTLLKTGSVFKREERTENLSFVAKSTASLAFSYLLLEITTQADRIILKNMISAEAVSVYYVVSLIGKALIMFVGPINNLTLAHISSGKSNQSKKSFYKAFALYSVISAVFYLFCIVGTPLFVKIFYPNIYPLIQGLNLIVNGAQVLNFAASLPVILILAQLGSNQHLKINIFFSVIYIPLALVMTNFYGVWGYAWAALVANIVRYVAVFITGAVKFPK